MYLQKKKHVHIRCTYILNSTCQHHSHDPIGFTDRANYISETSLTWSEATKKPPASWIDSFAREERLARRVHKEWSLMEDVIGKYLARLRSIRLRVCLRYRAKPLRVIARILRYNLSLSLSLSLFTRRHNPRPSI